MSRSKSWIFTLVVLAGFSTAANAAIVIQSDTRDYEAQHRSNNDAYIASQNNTAARSGFQSNFTGGQTFSPGGIMPVYFLPLPALAPGESITGATFSVAVLPDSSAGALTPTFNADLYSLGVLDTIGLSSTEAQNFFYVGNTAQTSLSSPINGSVNRVMDNFLVPADFVANGGAESAPHTADLTSYIQALYADPGGNGFTPGTSFLVLRVTPDADTLPTSGTYRYSMAFMGDSTDGSPAASGSEAGRPTLTLDTVVPEPTSLSLLGLAGVALLSRRRPA